MNEPIRRGRPTTDRVEMPPTADAGGHIEGAPVPAFDSRSTRIEKPKPAAPVEKEHTWHRVYIDLGQSTDHITINELTFHQGQVAEVRDDLLPVLNETMYNTKMHERVVSGQVSPYGKRLQSGRY